MKYRNCTWEVRSAVIGRLAKNLQVAWDLKDNPWPVIANLNLKLKPYVDRPLVAIRD
jgi:hypothetical protein